MGKYYKPIHCLFRHVYCSCLNYCVHISEQLLMSGISMAVCRFCNLYSFSSIHYVIALSLLFSFTGSSIIFNNLLTLVFKQQTAIPYCSVYLIKSCLRAPRVRLVIIIRTAEYFFYKIIILYTEYPLLLCIKINL